MTHCRTRFQAVAPLSSVLFSFAGLMGQVVSNQVPENHIYAGNTHSHTAETWSHGDQWTKSDCRGILVYANNAWSDGYVKSTTGCAGIFVINGLQYPSPSVVLKSDFRQYQ